ncbi:hypothetical protein MPH61_23325 [Peribacillus muralis]|uniref:hypothetical protein n=1 Tax=Peribacillus muralis TaxID=264697 RepID=UPI001F4EF8F8|nr:hypothetical protein [Peribacillus muralis]MCK1995457.1 hypothetical protein [Peribacillus muralis]MCK2016040.1 hypothetical protein [Peribacillus muralis]
MLESSTMEMGKLYISLFIIFSMVSLALFFSEINHANDFKQYVNYQIERNGGLTGEALTKVDAYNQEHYGGKFNIQSAQKSQQLSFGKEIDYTIKTKHVFFFLPLLSKDISVKGSAISQIR